MGDNKTWESPYSNNQKGLYHLLFKQYLNSTLYIWARQQTVSIKRGRKMEEILDIWSFWLTIEKVSSGSWYYATCRPAGALVCGESTFLHTRRVAGAFKGWCAVRTLQDGNSVLYFCTKSSLSFISDTAKTNPRTKRKAQSNVRAYQSAKSERQRWGY